MKEQKISIKEIIKIIVFVILTGLLLWYSALVLEYSFDQDGYNRKLRNGYNAMADDSLDVLFVGSSATDRFWIPVLGWDRMGFTSFDKCCNGTPTPLLPEVIEEATKKQSPQLVVIELRRAVKPITSFGAMRTRRLANNFVSGKTKKKLVDKVFALTDKYVGDEEMYDKVDTSDKSYMYKYLRIHNNWKTGVKLSQFYTLFPETEDKGYDTVSKIIWSSTPYDTPEFTDETIELGEFETEGLDILLDYCDTLDCDVLFLSTPFTTSEERYQQINMAKKIVQDRGYDVLDLNDEKMFTEYSLDFSKDYYNELHTNLSGAVKTSNAILDYLEANYDLPDHRDDEKYSEEWNYLYKKLVKLTKEYRPEWVYLFEE